MINAETLGRTLIEMTKEGDVDTHLEVFLRFAQSRNLTHLLPAVVAFLEQLSRAEKSTKNISITTARDVSKDLVQKIKEMMDVKGHVEHTVDEGLIGGFTLEAHNKLYDASIKNALARLGRELAV